jgi:hypothetical protein
MEETKMFFPIAQPDFWKKFRITIEEVITEKLSPQIFPQTNLYVLRKRMLFRNSICNIYKVSGQVFYPQQKQKIPKILRLNVDDIFKEKILKLL